MSKFRCAAKMIAVLTYAYAPESRERSFAVKHLEDWCDEVNSAIARNPNASTRADDPELLRLLEQIDAEARDLEVQYTAPPQPPLVVL